LGVFWGAAEGDDCFGGVPPKAATILGLPPNAATILGVPLNAATTATIFRDTKCCFWGYHKLVTVLGAPNVGDYFWECLKVCLPKILKIWVFLYQYKKNQRLFLGSL